ncbi:hypothetical protein JN00_0337 [Metamycoplasma subdolum]|uniref:Uncharacterized protein n=1 Tax=Metamycoplasma subdolum TaxID=92407 RepID=A0A3M0A1J7_9BACT|nr:hypothetical protein [Metamycoplasma subdolum]RMA78507.1 hypothetical protein JN00_0337 [Metamycoplasma subdolum]WPB50439.1 hypothetical protein R9C05_02430 [Metamycoplasma subdolum]
MKKWQIFEKECESYLSKIITSNIKIELIGGSNSKESDIQITTTKGTKFFIEIKMSPAQCGQFVLYPNLKTKKFEYSSKNIHHINVFSKMIIEYMNCFFSEFYSASTRGKLILFDGHESIFANWIKQAYSVKNVKYFIINDFIIVPIQEFEKAFFITAKYRVKRSGSSNVSLKNMKNLIDFLTTNFKELQSFKISKNKLFVTTDKNIDKKRFVFQDNNYIVAKREENYEIRKLAKTCNANVIFSIVKKPSYKGITKEEFLAQINSY